MECAWRGRENCVRLAQAANTAAEQGHFGPALELYGQALSGCPPDVPFRWQVHLAIIQLYCRQRDWGSANVALAVVLPQVPSGRWRAKALHMRALVLGELSHPDAVAAFAAAEQEAKPFSDIVDLLRANLAVLHLRAGRTAEALRLQPQNLPSVNRALLEHRIGNHSAALGAMQEAIKVERRLHRPHADALRISLQHRILLPSLEKDSSDLVRFHAALFPTPSSPADATSLYRLFGHAVLLRSLDDCFPRRIDFVLDELRRLVEVFKSHPENGFAVCSSLLKRLFYRSAVQHKDLLPGVVQVISDVLTRNHLVFDVARTRNQASTSVISAAEATLSTQLNQYGAETLVALDLLNRNYCKISRAVWTDLQHPGASGPTLHTSSRISSFFVSALHQLDRAFGAFVRCLNPDCTRDVYFPVCESLPQLVNQLAEYGLAFDDCFPADIPDTKIFAELAPHVLADLQDQGYVSAACKVAKKPPLPWQPRRWFPSAVTKQVGERLLHAAEGDAFKMTADKWKFDHKEKEAVFLELRQVLIGAGVAKDDLHGGMYLCGSVAALPPNLTLSSFREMGNVLRPLVATRLQEFSNARSRTLSHPVLQSVLRQQPFSCWERATSAADMSAMWLEMTFSIGNDSKHLRVSATGSDTVLVDASLGLMEQRVTNTSIDVRHPLPVVYPWSFALCAINVDLPWKSMVKVSTQVREFLFSTFFLKVYVEDNRSYCAPPPSNAVAQAYLVALRGGIAVNVAASRNALRAEFIKSLHTFDSSLEAHGDDIFNFYLFRCHRFGQPELQQAPDFGFDLGHLLRTTRNAVQEIVLAAATPPTALSPPFPRAVVRPTPTANLQPNCSNLLSCFEFHSLLQSPSPLLSEDTINLCLAAGSNADSWLIRRWLKLVGRSILANASYHPGDKADLRAHGLAAQCEVNAARVCHASKLVTWAGKHAENSKGLFMAFSESEQENYRVRLLPPPGERYDGIPSDFSSQLLNLRHEAARLRYRFFDLFAAAWVSGDAFDWYRYRQCMVEATEPLIQARHLADQVLTRFLRERVCVPTKRRIMQAHFPVAGSVESLTEYFNKVFQAAVAEDDTLAEPTSATLESNFPQEWAAILRTQPLNSSGAWLPAIHSITNEAKHELLNSATDRTQLLNLLPSCFTLPAAAAVGRLTQVNYRVIRLYRWSFEDLGLSAALSAELFKLFSGQQASLLSKGRQHKNLRESNQHQSVLPKCRRYFDLALQALPQDAALWKDGLQRERVINNIADRLKQFGNEELFNPISLIELLDRATDEVTQLAIVLANRNT